MKRVTVSFYSPATGLFNGQQYSGPESGIAEDLDGLAYIEGEYHLADWRVQDGKVVPREIPHGHVWHAPTASFVHQSKLEAARRDSEVRAEIARLERTQQRPIREHLAGDAEALGRVLDIDARIAQLRKELASHAI